MSKRVTRKRKVTLVKNGARAGGAKRTRSRFAALRGTATVRMSTRQIMALTRGED
jgi:acyl-CoA synthetase (NDP forming)